MPGQRPPLGEHEASALGVEKAVVNLSPVRRIPSRGYSHEHKH